MALITGTALALVVGLFATRVGLDRDRAFYPTVMIVIALLYVLFAAMGGSRETVLAEVLVAAAFIAAAVWGFKSSLWIVVIALAFHGIQDLFHTRVIANPGVPGFWPEFCSTYDVAAAAYLAWSLMRSRSPYSSRNVAVTSTRSAERAGT